MLYVKMTGGLGNQMFSYAFARAYQLRYHGGATLINETSGLFGHDSCQLRQLTIAEEKVPILSESDASWRRKFSTHLFFRLFRKFLHVCSKEDLRKRFALERELQPLMNAFGVCYNTSCAYVPVRKPLFCKSMITCGHFQSASYFDAYADTIRKELRFTASPSAQDSEILRVIEQTDAVCLHARRGDYTLPENRLHLVCTVEYYQKAIEEMLRLRAAAHFFVFSDDLPWARQNLRFPDGRVTFVDNHNPAAAELRLMYACRHFILSNSSFSWWAQYLGDYPGKIVIAPDRWYNDERKVDIYQKAWICVRV
jgi:hypothetical protein